MPPVILADLADRFDPRHTALLIVDMQKDFCIEGYVAHKAGRDLTAAKAAIPGISKLLHAARDTGAKVAHVGLRTLPDNGSDSGPWLAQRVRSTASSPVLCIAGSDGEKFIDELAPVDGEFQIHKHRYSSFGGTNLDLLLSANGIKSIVVTGVSTNACVESTVRHGFELDYYIAVPPEAVASWDMKLHEATLANVNHRFGVTPSVDELIGIWRARPNR